MISQKRFVRPLRRSRRPLQRSFPVCLSWQCRGFSRSQAPVSKHDEFCVYNKELCIKNKGMCIKNQESCIQNDEFCSAVPVYLFHPYRLLKQVSFQWQNPDFLIRNPDFLLKNLDFIIKPQLREWELHRGRGSPRAGRTDARVANCNNKKPTFY